MDRGRDLRPTTSSPEPGTDRFFDGTVGPSLLGLAYVVAGAWLFYGITVGSTALVIPALAAVLLLVVVSPYLLYRREGLVTAENGVIGACVLAAMVLYVGLSGFTELRSVFVLGAVFVVGVLVPGLLLEYTDYGRDD